MDKRREISRRRRRGRSKRLEGSVTVGNYRVKADGIDEACGVIDRIQYYVRSMWHLTEYTEIPIGKI